LGIGQNLLVNPKNMAKIGCEDWLMRPLKSYKEVVKREFA
jgi:hypothetical protein